MSNILKNIDVGGTAPSKDIVLELKNVSHWFYQGGVKIEILNNASLQIKKGEIVALVGPSGSGKSTLLHLAGLLESPKDGDVLINGKKMRELNDTQKTNARLKKIGFVYQVHNLLSDFTALENVMIPMLLNGKSKVDAELAATSLLKKLGLEQRMKHTPTLMSGGEAQRVAIARAMANNPDILLADEPTGSLDPKTSDFVYDEFINSVKEKGLAALIVTHDVALARKMDRILRLKNGQII
ncbi:MAG: ABC transporter ATP-binding protein [Rickettsiales bacterium]|jgi:lipoprotein-releasing system ATP-binding protein|nr:ABC transporter ATP-binding protein [Rickettsiales bacterium]